MSRTDLKTPNSRQPLHARHAQYWAEIDKGIHLGYRKSPGGGVWYIRRFVDGKYIVRRIGLADDNQPADGIAVLSHKQARKRANAYEDILEQFEQPKHPALFTVSDAMRDYLEWYKAHRKAHDRTKDVIKGHITPTLGSVPLGSLTPQRISRWLQDLATSAPTSKRNQPVLPYAIQNDTGKRTRGAGRIVYENVPLPYEQWTDEMKRKRKSTANRVLTVLKAGLNHAWRMDKISDASPWQKVKPFHAVEAPRVSHLTEKQANKLITAARKDFRPLVKAALMTGCRYGELTRLAARDFKAGQLFIERTKTGKSRYVPLSDEGREFFRSLAKGKNRDDLLLAHEDGSPWAHSHQVRPMREACVKAGINPPVGFHVLRHTYATLLLRSGESHGVSIRYVSELIGDSVATCEKHYGHVIQDDLRAEVARKLPSFGGAA